MTGVGTGGVSTAASKKQAVSIKSSCGYCEVTYCDVNDYYQMAPVGADVSSGKSSSKSGFNSWAQLSKSSQSQTKTVATKDTFAAFRKQAKDKEDKQKLLQEQQRLRLAEREAAERERQRQERERQKEREEEEYLERTRRGPHGVPSAGSTGPVAVPSPVAAAVANMSQTCSPRPNQPLLTTTHEPSPLQMSDSGDGFLGSPSPSSQGSMSPAQSSSERERLRKKEQERRRREAVSISIMCTSLD